MRSIITRTALTLAAASALFGVACGGSDPATPAAISTTPPLPTTTAVAVIDIPVGNPATQAATPNSQQVPFTPIPAEIVTPTPTPAPPPPVPSEMPRVLSMRSAHAGPGAVIVRFSTNVPTTAEVRTMNNQSGPLFFASEELTTLATEHEVAMPVGAPGRFVVIVEDQFGNEAVGNLRYLTDPHGIEFGVGQFKPIVEAKTAKQLVTTWGFSEIHPSFLPEPGNVLVYATPTTCTTADACPGELVDTDSAQVEQYQGAYFSTVASAIPGSAFNYQVIVAEELTGDHSTMAFIQLEIRGDQLPKTNFSGPKTITQ